MDEREKDNLANVSDTKNGYSYAGVDPSVNSDIIQIIDDEEDVDYDQEYMTNVSNNLVSEVDALLKEEAEETKEETTEPLPVVPEEKEEPKEEVVEKVEENEKSFEDLRREQENNKSFEELKREQMNEKMEHKNQKLETKINK